MCCEAGSDGGRRGYRVLACVCCNGRVPVASTFGADTGGDAGGETGSDAGGDGVVGGGALAIQLTAATVQGVGTGCLPLCFVTDMCPLSPFLEFAQLAPVSAPVAPPESAQVLAPGLAPGLAVTDWRLPSLGRY